jgi:hypothetical protein
MLLVIAWGMHAGDQGSQLAKADEELRKLREQIAALE